MRGTAAALAATVFVAAASATIPSVWPAELGSNALRSAAIGAASIQVANRNTPPRRHLANIPAAVERDATDYATDARHHEQLDYSYKLVTDAEIPRGMGGPGLQQLVQLGRSLAPAPMIIAVTTYSYLLTAINFAATIKRYGDQDQQDLRLASFVPIALDNQTADMLKHIGLSTGYGQTYSALRSELKLCDAGGCPAVSGHNVNRNGIWAFRSALLMYLVRHGVDVLMNDLDARWVHDPVTQMQQRFPAADVVASRGSWPPNNGWGGATVCMGFAYFRSTSATRAYFAEASRILSLPKDALKSAINDKRNLVSSRQNYDDQAFFNGVFNAGNISWNGLEVGAANLGHTASGPQVVDLGIAHYPKLVHGDDRAVAGVAKDSDADGVEELVLALLPIGHVTRDCKATAKADPESKNVWVEHCPKHNLDKKQRSALEAAHYLLSTHDVNTLMKAGPDTYLAEAAGAAGTPSVKLRAASWRAILRVVGMSAEMGATDRNTVVN